MGIYQKFRGFDDYFASSNPNGRIVLNTLSYWSSTDRELLEKTIKTVYSEDTLSLVPSCSCGDTKGGYLLGMVCPTCNSKVEDIFASKDPLIWFYKLDGCEGFISPQFYSMVKRTLGGRIDILRYIGDSSYNPPLGSSEYLIEIVKSIPNFKRTYSWLVQNLETVLLFFINNPTIKAKNKDKRLIELRSLYKKNKDKIISNYLSLLNKRMFLMEKSTKGKYVSLGLNESYDIVMGFINKVKAPNLIHRERAMAKTVAKLAELYEINVRSYLGSKPGIFRKHVYGTRSHFTARAVISIIPGPHDATQIKIPWGIANVVLRPHILNLLIKRKFTYKQAIRKLNRAIQHFDKEIADILDYLLHTSPNGLIPVLMQRNPSLMQGSMLRLDVNEIKKDPQDTTINISQLLCTWTNHDYDGDEMNLTFLLDSRMAELTETLRPYYSIPSMDDLFAVSGLPTITKTGMSLISERIKAERKELEENLIRR